MSSLRRMPSPSKVGAKTAVFRTIGKWSKAVRGAPDNDKARELFGRSYEMVLNVFGNEDFRAAAISQAGLESGGIKETIYGGLENQIPIYYDILEKHFDAH